MGVLHVVLNALDFDMTMVEAVSAPRFSATSDTIDISNRIQWKVERELQALDYPVVRSPYTFGFAAVRAGTTAQPFDVSETGPLVNGARYVLVGSGDVIVQSVAP